MNRCTRGLGAALLLFLVACNATPTVAPTDVAPPTSLPSPAPSPTSTASPTAIPPVIPLDQLSLEEMLATIDDLAAIQPYSGWRNSATSGEAEALDYVAARLAALPYLQELGLELERQTLHVLNSTEIWQSSLYLTVDGQEIEIPAEAMRGNREDVSLALRFDSDGRVNDSANDPMVAGGPPVLVRSYGDVQALTHDDVAGRVVWLDYAAIDSFVLDAAQSTFPLAPDLLALQPAGVVVVTEYSDRPGESHGTFAGDSNPLMRVAVGLDAPVVPILFVTMEALAGAGIAGWDDLPRIEAARLVWDADVMAPGVSGNLVARIPGVDPTRALILGAHIDSPNSPGAMDDGSGSAILLEVARVLDAAQLQPPVDLYLAWFGSEEIGLYGSAHFAATHQELLDRTIGMLQIDCLTHPMETIEVDLSTTTWPYGHVGGEGLPWSDWLFAASAAHDVAVEPLAEYALYSDNAVVIGFDVPNVNLGYEGRAMARFGPIHYAAHIHDPYETAEVARRMSDVLEQMAEVALITALEAGRSAEPTRITPPPDRRALLIGSHTEVLKMTPVGFMDFGLALSMAGFDVDLLPYGQPLTPADLEGVSLAIALPVIDLPGQGGDMSVYDEAWSDDEIATLLAYVEGGGLLVLANSASRLGSFNVVYDLNEDWRDVNALAEPLGIHYRFGTFAESMFWTRGASPLLEGISYLEMTAGNGIPFTMEDGQPLADVDGRLVMGLVDYGAGQVLALADVGILGSNGLGAPANLRLWQNLADYARSR